MNIPKNARNQQQLRLKDKVFQPKSQVIYNLVLNIVQPLANSEAEQQAYQDFAQAFSDFNPRT